MNPKSNLLSMAVGQVLLLLPIGCGPYRQPQAKGRGSRAFAISRGWFVGMYIGVWVFLCHHVYLWCAMETLCIGLLQCMLGVILTIDHEDCLYLYLSYLSRYPWEPFGGLVVV